MIDKLPRYCKIYQKFVYIIKKDRQNFAKSLKLWRTSSAKIGIETITAQDESVLSKVATGRARAWGKIMRNIQYKYFKSKQRMNRVLENQDPESQYHHLCAVISCENIDKVNTVLFDSQNEVATLTNKNEFLRESVRLFGKRKRDDDNNDENIRPSKR
ncbi:hypothetical protein K501DRAFT_272477 [Backusella circina FSU 941]|nr:hypothetical protein K501DRAFT_272477 [Backusella circina FSU 941]